jgi:hypothetical protein
MGTGVLLAFLYLKFISGPKYTTYEDSLVKGTIQKITGFGRGMPTVIINNKEMTLLSPDAFGKHLAVGDSVVKLSGTRNISIFRKGPKNIEVTHWEYVNTNGYEQVKETKRYILLK